MVTKFGYLNTKLAISWLAEDIH